MGPTRFAGAGLWLCPVEHEGNQTSSPEEVERVAEIVAELTDARRHAGSTLKGARSRSTPRTS